MTQVAPYGSWRSPITPELVVAGAVRLGDVQVAGGTTWWSEARPQEGGRVQVVRLEPGGEPVDVLPDGWSARTRVHEYGGAAWWVDGPTLYVTSWDDQRLYRLDPGARPVALTPVPDEPHALRYADGRVTPDGRWVVCVRERHDDGAVVNEIVAVPTDGRCEVHVLVTGPDFVASPRLSRDGRQLAWIAWDHPNMPWDGTELWVARLAGERDRLWLEAARRLAGGPEEALMEPNWGRHAQLFVISDRTGWWNVYRVDGIDSLTPVAPVEAEVGGPAWVLGTSHFAVDRDGTVVGTFSRDGEAHLVVTPEGGEPREAVLPFAAIDAVRVAGGRATFLAMAADHDPIVARVDLASPWLVETLRPARDLGIDPAAVSRPEPISFPSANGRTAYGWFYAPRNPDVEGPEGERPPLVVMSHGGPTAAANPWFDPAVLYWTTRGIAVVDVDYGGSTGYGRAYRRLLDGAWGIVDVEDCVHAVQYLVGTGRVDGERVAIRGGSAGGFTTLATLVSSDVVKAGASYYGVADLAALARDTHKFESRYLDRLIGPWPAAADVYAERSPLTHADRLSCPVIVFQGLEDAVVPPNQAEAMVAALDAKAIPHAYLAFEGEQHGFRRADTIKAALTAEASFYAQVFGFELAGDVTPVAIRHADRLPSRSSPGGH